MQTNPRFTLHRNTRRQLTLFINPEDSHGIEDIRRKFNPEQYHLIAGHVTLCREDEIENLTVVLNNLQQLDTESIIIQFGQVKRFDDNSGALLPALGDNKQFHQLRSILLAGLNKTLRHHQPHITLMHPRNSTCTDKIFKEIQKANFPASLRFDIVSLIEQVEGGQWKPLEKYTLKRH